MTHPPISPRWGGLSFLKASQMRPAVLEGVEERVREAGLDVHYGLGPSFSLDLSLNTDFAQVEADDQEVNLDRFSLFFPEKRRFFQERAGVFERTLLRARWERRDVSGPMYDVDLSRVGDIFEPGLGFLLP